MKIKPKLNFKLLNAIGIVTIATVFWANVLSSNVAWGDTELSNTSLDTEQTIQYFPYINPTPGHLPIIACDPAYQDTIPTFFELKRAADCGFNLVQRAYHEDTIPKILNNIKNSGVRLVVRNMCLYTPKMCNMITNKFKDSTDVAFWQLFDEPTSKKMICTLGEFSDSVYSHDKTRLIMTNFLATLNSEASIDFKSHDEYIEFIKKEMRPAVWPFDHYPVCTKKTINGNDTTLIEYFDNNYYSILRKFANLANETDRPFWSYVISTDVVRKGLKDISNPRPTRGSLRLLALAPLAYGAKGLCYWTYAQRPCGEDIGHTIAPINLKGEKTELWDSLKLINDFIHKYEYVFLNSKFVDSRYAGGDPIQNEKLLTGPFGPVKDIILHDTKKYTSDGEITIPAKGVIITHLRQNGLNYLIILNRDYKDSQTINITFNEHTAVEKIISFDKETFINNNVVRSGISPINEITLQPGEIYIFPWFEY